MKRSLLFCQLIMLVVMGGAVHTADGAAVTSGEHTFRIERFVVTVEHLTDTAPVHGVVPAPVPWPRPNAGLGNARFSGTGFVRIKGAKVPVTFRNVRLQYSQNPPVYTASSGTVQGKSGPAKIQYDLSAMKIVVARESLLITPATAYAQVKMTVPVSSFAVATSSPITLSTPTCRIGPDGSVSGDNFRGLHKLAMRDTVYTLSTVTADRNSVQLGPLYLHGGYGVELHGAALRDNRTLFTYSGRIAPFAARASFTLELLPFSPTEPELSYRLELNSGSVRYSYTANTQPSCEGMFSANLTLPPATTNQAGQPVRLTNIELRTDRSGALFNYLTVPGGIKINDVFFLEPAKEKTWAYFPVWHLDRHSSYPKAECQALFGFLDPDPTAGAVHHNPGRRPGLTVLSGIFHMTAAQISVTGAPAAARSSVKTPFWGALTVTPLGMTGELTSSGSSFVPEGSDIRLSSVPTAVKRYPLQQVLAMGNTRPDEPAERFRLADLAVLEMRAEKITFCMNKVTNSMVRYLVHFPFPSYVDLEFEDTSLDSRGMFKNAAGPVARQSWEFDRAPSTDMLQTLTTATYFDRKKTGISTRPVLDEQVLWAWRLPVMFSDRGVVINYPAVDRAAVAEVRMTSPGPGNTEVASSELGFSLLYSDRSALKFGVRFSGTLASQGQFALAGWDVDPFFGRHYHKQFSCKLKGPTTDPTQNGLVLAGDYSRPASNPFDFSWNGAIRLPFFSGENPAAWQPVKFLTKDLLPRQEAPISVAGSRTRSRCTLLSSGSASYTTGPAENALSLQVKDLSYVYDQVLDRGSFLSTSVSGTETRNSVASRLTASSIEIDSFTRGLVRTNPTTTDLAIGAEMSTDTNACGQTTAIWVKQTVKDAVKSTDLQDIVCYDAAANRERGICDACSKEYWLGTYEVSTRRSQTDPDRVILSSPDTAYYPYDGNRKLELQNGGMELRSDEVDTSQASHSTTINIPGAVLSFLPDGTITGDFGATLASVASSLPYEGEFRFMVNPNCGHYYFLGAGSFTYYLRFSGSSFIVHAPYGRLTSLPSHLGVTDLLQDLRIRTLFTSRDDFKKAIGLNGLGDTTLISGVLTAGNASYTFGIGPLSVKVGAGPGAYLLRFKSAANPGPIYRIGTFVNGLATADIYLLTALGGVTLPDASVAVQDRDYDSFRQVIEDAAFKIDGSVKLNICGDALLGHCEAGAKFDASYSTTSGFEGSNVTVCGDCDTGGCPSSPCP